MLKVQYFTKLVHSTKEALYFWPKAVGIAMKYLDVKKLQINYTT